MPLGTINEPFGEVLAGDYFYLPQFQDTRIYHLEKKQEGKKIIQNFQLLLEDLEEI